MSKLIVESSNILDTPADIEDKIEKAYNSIQLQRDKKEFSDVYLKSKKDKLSQLVTKLLHSMIDEVSEVLEST
jgi:hypothetical protein|nr:MAG TPA: hypothetical protein [Herelleviridae sp.]